MFVRQTLDFDAADMNPAQDGRPAAELSVVPVYAPPNTRRQKAAAVGSFPTGATES